jgi:hypothetical protein
MICWRVAAIMMTMLIPASGYAVNPFLDTPDAKPVSAKFRGIEWSDEIEEEEIPHTRCENAVGRDFQN